MELQLDLSRLLETKLLGGLALRFFGVFVVLGILMVVLYITGWFFHRFLSGDRETPEKEALPSGAPPVEGSAMARDALAGTAEASSVTGDVAAAIVLGLREAARSVASSGFPVAGEVAAAVALALSAGSGEGALPVLRAGDAPHAAGPHSGWGARESAWKLIGRQEAVSRNNPCADRRFTDRETTNRESKA